MAIGRLGSVSGPLAAGQILAAGAGTAGVLLAASPGLVVAALAAVQVMRRSGQAADTVAAPLQKAGS